MPAHNLGAVQNRPASASIRFLNSWGSLQAGSRAANGSQRMPVRGLSPPSAIVPRDGTARLIVKRTHQRDWDGSWQMSGFTAAIESREKNSRLFRQLRFLEQPAPSAASCRFSG